MKTLKRVLGWLGIAILIVQTPSAQDCDETVLTRIHKVVEIDLLLSRFQDLIFYYQAVNGSLPSSKDALVDWYKAIAKDPPPDASKLRDGDGLTISGSLVLDNEVDRALLLEQYFVPAAFPFRYRLSTDEGWSLLAEPPAGSSLMWVKIDADDWVSVGRTAETLQRMKPYHFQRIGDGKQKFGEKAATMLGGATEYDQLQLEALHDFATLQQVASARPELAASYLGSNGMLDLGKVLGQTKLSWLGTVAETHDIEVRRAGSGWQLVMWPKVHGQDTRFTYCQDDKGNVRVGDVGGSDDCSKVPCL